MRAVLHVTDLVTGAAIDLADAKLEPILPGFLRAEVGEAKPGDAVYLLVKATVQTVTP